MNKGVKKKQISFVRRNYYLALYSKAIILRSIIIFLLLMLSGCQNIRLFNKILFSNTAHAASINRGKLIRDGRALVWENTGEVFLVKGNTAWSIIYTPEPIDYRHTIDWSASHNFNLVRGSDLPELNDLAAWEKVDEITRYAYRKGIVIEWWNMRMNNMNREQWQHYADYAAERLEAHPNVIFASNTEGGETSLSTIRNMNSIFSNAFAKPPLLSVHPYRNQCYYPYPGSSDAKNYYISYHKVQRFGNNLQNQLFVDDYRNQRWLTLGMLHQRWMFDGFGIFQHRNYSNTVLNNLPLVVGEAIYERMNGTVTTPVTNTALDRFDMNDEISSNPRRYYRWYTFSSLLSGGSGVVYGMTDVGNSGFEKRYAYGLPDGGSSEGHQDIDEVLGYFAGKGFDPRDIVPNDQNVDSPNTRPGSSIVSADRGLKRPKSARVRNEQIYYVYNPYHTWVDINGLASDLSIELYNPKSGRTYFAGRTDGSDPFRFEAPTQFRGEYLLYISQTEATGEADETCPLSVDDWDYCLKCGPCSEGQGDCDNDAECQSDLECFQQDGVDYCQQPVSVLEPKHVQFKAKHSGKCMDIESGSARIGANAIQYTCAGFDNQRFELRPVGQNFQIVALHSGKCLEIEDGSSSDTANVQQNECTNSRHQLFDLRSEGQFHRIVALHSGKCLDVEGGFFYNKASVLQYGCGPWDNQLWNLQPSH